MSSHFPRTFLFSIRSVLDDLAHLRSTGMERLRDESPRLWEMAGGDIDPEALRPAFDEHYRRMQIIYREVAEESFAPVRDRLAFYNALPVRWIISVIDRASALGPTVQDNWMPVANWDQAGADVEFLSSPAPCDDSRFVRMREELQRLGRLTRHTAIFGGSRLLATYGDFNSRGLAAMESSPFHDACTQLKRDVERLFSDMPSHDRLEL